MSLLSSTFAIETLNLRKEFGSRAAVRNLTVNVRRGEIFGFLGPNGAGKSTSIKMLLGLVKPTSGNAFVLGLPSSDVEVREHIGFLPEDFRFYDWLTAAELLDFHGRLSGMSPRKLRTRVPEALALVGLTTQKDRRLRTFSKGMIQRIGLAQAIIHEPKIIFLDEPTSGLDPMGRRMVRDILRAQKERGATVFLNSHLLSEIEVTCDRVVFIKDGEVVATHDLGMASQEEIRIHIHARNLSTDSLVGLKQWTNSAKFESEQLSLSVPKKDMLPDIIRHLVRSGADIFGVAQERVSLEELFLKIMGEDPGL